MDKEISGVEGHSESPVLANKRPLEDADSSDIVIQHSRPRLNLNKEVKADKLQRIDSKARRRWFVHRMVEDSANFSGDLLYPRGLYESFGYDTNAGTFPFARMSTLGYLTNPLRRKNVPESWSPIEVALFEAGIMTHGKKFNEIQRQVKSKTTKEIIEYYYFWKKTAHYKQWKQHFIPDPKTHPHLAAGTAENTKEKSSD